MPFVQADIDALDKAFATGAETVRTADGRTVTYRSVSEYRELKGLMQAEIADAAGVPVQRMVRVGFSFGVTA